MSVTLLVTLATLLLENKNFLAFASVIKYSCCNLSTINVRCTDLNCSVLVDKEYLVELDSSTLLSREAVDEDFHTSLYFELLACNVYDCVHKKLKILKVLDSRRLPWQLFNYACQSVNIFYKKLLLVLELHLLNVDSLLHLHSLLY